MDEVKAAVATVEKEMGKKFGDKDNTLLFSVRSGAAMSMPGMMDTVLNVGLNDVVVEGLAKQVNDRFAWDCYRRLLQVRLGRRRWAVCAARSLDKDLVSASVWVWFLGADLAVCCCLRATAQAHRCQRPC